MPSIVGDFDDIGTAYYSLRITNRGDKRPVMLFCGSKDWYAPDEAMARGVADLKVLANLLSIDTFLHGTRPTNIDAGIYGFIANILFYDFDTPLKQCVEAHPQLGRHCREIHARIGGD
jgi:glutathione S-transferase